MKSAIPILLSAVICFNTLGCSPEPATKTEQSEEALIGAIIGALIAGALIVGFGYIVDRDLNEGRGSDWVEYHGFAKPLDLLNRYSLSSSALADRIIEFDTKLRMRDGFVPEKYTQYQNGNFFWKRDFVNWLREEYLPSYEIPEGYSALATFGFEAVERQLDEAFEEAERRWQCSSKHSFENMSVPAVQTCTSAQGIQVFSQTVGEQQVVLRLVAELPTTIYLDRTPEGEQRILQAGEQLDITVSSEEWNDYSLVVGTSAPRSLVSQSRLFAQDQHLGMVTLKRLDPLVLKRSYRHHEDIFADVCGGLSYAQRNYAMECTLWLLKLRTGARRLLATHTCEAGTFKRDCIHELYTSPGELSGNEYTPPFVTDSPLLSEKCEPLSDERVTLPDVEVCLGNRSERLAVLINGSYNDGERVPGKAPTFYNSSTSLPVYLSGEQNHEQALGAGQWFEVETADLGLSWSLKYGSQSVDFSVSAFHTDN